MRSPDAHALGRKPAASAAPSGAAALALLGLALGVATIIAVDIATASSGRAFELSMEAVNGAATHEIAAGPGGIDEQLYVKLRTSGTPIATRAGRRGLCRRRGPDDAAHRHRSAGRRRRCVADAKAAREPERASAVTTCSRAIAGSTRAARVVHRAGAVVIARQTGRAARDRARYASSRSGSAASTQPAHADRLARRRERRASTRCCSRISRRRRSGSACMGRLSRIDVRVPAGADGERALEALRASLPPGVELRPAQTAHAAKPRHDGSVHDQSAGDEPAGTARRRVSHLQRDQFRGRAAAARHRRAARARRHALSACSRWCSTEAAAARHRRRRHSASCSASLIGRELVALVSRTINDLYFVVAVNEVVIAARLAVVEGRRRGLGVALVAAAVPAIEVANSAPQLGLRRSVIEQRAVRRVALAARCERRLAAAPARSCSSPSEVCSRDSSRCSCCCSAVAALTPALLRALAHARGARRRSRSVRSRGSPSATSRPR